MLSSMRFPESNNMMPSLVEDDSFQSFKKWILSTYGDGSKTKTITWSKYLRIHKVLSGRSLGESPKFKFWIKTKGFCFLPCPKLNGRPSEMSGMVIALPNRKTSIERVYKRVAVVEEFFDIIYDIHVNIDGRNGKHAGQKRTYRTIIESYAFLPREAVTHFLMSCKECRGRMHIPPTTDCLPWCSQAECLTSSPFSISTLTPDRSSSPVLSELSIDVESDTLNPSTMSLAEDTTSPAEQQTKLQTSNSESSTPSTSTATLAGLTKVASYSSAPDMPSATAAGHTAAPVAAATMNVEERKAEESSPLETSHIKEEPLLTDSSIREQLLGETVDLLKKEEMYDEKSVPKFPLMSTPLKRSADSSFNLSPTMSKKSSDDADDEDDEDDDEKMLSNSGSNIDPERLKAFNMFCRLFVDENLDRLVPISKQPKDKVQKILDACDRQFPEFHERSRKRIRTYLKSCRRMRRTREMNGHSREASRPTPPHLTSPVAEHLLSVACDNEAKNFRLISMGLEPSNTPPRTKTLSNPIAASSLASTATGVASMPSLIPANLAQSTSPSAPSLHRMFPEWRFPHATPFRHDLTPFFGNGLFRPPFPGFPGQLPGPALQASQAAATQLSLTINDINAQKQQSSTSLPTSASPSKKSSNLEWAAIRQTIAGYRESATYLYQSADHLEKLLSQAN